MARVLVSAVVSILLIGCRDSAGVGNVAGFYELTAVDGLELPRVVSATTCDQQVLRGGLHRAVGSVTFAV